MFKRAPIQPNGGHRPIPVPVVITCNFLIEWASGVWQFCLRRATKVHLGVESEKVVRLCEGMEAWLSLVKLGPQIDAHRHMQSASQPDVAEITVQLRQESISALGNLCNS